MAADPLTRFPSVAYLEKHAKRRIPHFAWEYLAQGTGAERAMERNVEALQDVLLTPEFGKGLLDPDLSTVLFGVEYELPVGIAPVGLTGLIWPGADQALARTAAARRIPYVASTVGTGELEDVGPMAKGMGWFQLYPPRDMKILESLLGRAEAAGFTTLVITADVPAASRRERQTRAEVTVPPKITPKLVARAAIRPAWSMGILKSGLPRFRTLERYVDAASMKQTAGFVGANLGGTLSWDYMKTVRTMWDGPMVIKGLLHPDDAERAVAVGSDGIVVSNHGGRQFDGAPASIEALPPIVDRVGGELAIMFDSGVRSGLDIARALALGADFAFAGRAFMFGLGAMGASGPDHVATLFELEMKSVLHNLGCASPAELRSRHPRFR